MVTLLARATGGTAAILGAATGDALGRPVTGLSGAAANVRTASSDTAVAYVAAPASEVERIREALPGTPSAATMVGLVLVEAARHGPTDPVVLVDDALRRVLAVGFTRGKNPHGALAGASPVLAKTLRDYTAGAHALSCAGDQPDATLLPAALMLGACGTPLERSATLLRAVNRHPITLSAAITLSELVRGAIVGEVTTESIVRTARQAEERVLAVVGSLPGTLAGPPEMGHGAMALSLARAQSAPGSVDALLPLSHDSSAVPEVVLSAVLGALLVEPTQLARQVALVLRHGGAAQAAASVLVGLHGALLGLGNVPLGWLAGLREGASLLAFAEAATSSALVPFPAADLCFTWARAEQAFHDEREDARRTAPAPMKKEQLGLFGGS